MKREVSVTWYTDPEEAAADLREEHERMLPDQRVAECVRLMIQAGGWEEHGRLARVARIVAVP